MDPTEKIKKSFIAAVEHSNLACILVEKESDNLTLLAISSSSSLVVRNIETFITTGSFVFFVNNISNLSIGKTMTDLVYYKDTQIVLKGEVVSINLFLIELTKPKTNETTSHSSPQANKIVYELKSDLKEASIHISNLKEDIVSNTNQVKEIESKLETVEDKFVIELKEVARNLQNKVEVLQDKISELREIINNLENNSLLKFTSDLDFKKTAAIVGILVSILSSAGLFEGWVSNSIDNNGGELEDKIEKLLELSGD